MIPYILIISKIQNQMIKVLEIEFMFVSYFLNLYYFTVAFEPP